MNNMPKPRSLLLLAALAPVILMLLSTDVCAQTAKRGAAQSSAAYHRKTKRKR